MSEKFTTEVSTFRHGLDISGGNANGEIIMWGDNGGHNQKWNFDEDMTIRSGLGSLLEARGVSPESTPTIFAANTACQAKHKFRVVPVSE